MIQSLEYYLIQLRSRVGEFELVELRHLTYDVLNKFDYIYFIEFPTVYIQISAFYVIQNQFYLHISLSNFYIGCFFKNFSDFY